MPKKCKGCGKIMCSCNKNSDICSHCRLKQKRKKDARKK
jgi:hypothetical protein